MCIRDRYFIFVKTDADNWITEISKDNNTVRSTAALTVSLKPLPDILVKGIQSATANVKPGDSLLISWQVENTGTVPALGGWSERITLVPASGTEMVLVPNSNFAGDLAAKATLSRSEKFKIPEILRFSGSAKIKIELIPSATLIEHASGQANNTAV